MKRTYLLPLWIVIGALGFSSSMQSIGLGSLLSVNDKKESGQKTPFEKQIEVITKKQTDYQEQMSEYTKMLDELAVRVSHLKTQENTVERPEAEYLQKQLMLVSKSQQAVAEIIQVLRRILSALEENQKVLKKVKTDPTFSELRMPTKAAPTFDDLQKASDRLATYKSRLDDLEKARKTLLRDIEQRKKVLDAVAKELTDKKIQRDTFTQEDKTVEALAKFSKSEQGVIIDDQLKNLEYQKKLAELKVSEDDARLVLLDSQLSMTRKQVEIVEKEYNQVKHQVNIDAEYIKKERARVENMRQEFFDKRQGLNSKINPLLPRLERTKSQLEEIISTYEFSATKSAEIRSWQLSLDALTTPEEWLGTALFGSHVAKEQFLETQLDLLRARISLERLTFQVAEDRVDVIRSWRRMTQRRLRYRFDEEVDQEVRKYSTERSQLKADLTELFDKRDRVTQELYQLNVAREKIKEILKELKDKDSLLAGDKPLYKEVYTHFSLADEELSKQINLNARLLEVYAKSIAKVRQGVKQVDDVIAELSTKSFWMRSDQSIEWKDVKNFIPDVERFVKDLRETGFEYLSEVSVQKITNVLKRFVVNVYQVVLLTLRIIIALLVFLLLRSYLPDLHTYLVKGGRCRIWGVTQIIGFCAASVDFVSRHLFSIYLWGVAFVIIQSGVFNDYFATLFYLLSIFYLLWLLHQLFEHIIEVNKERAYLIISKDYQSRFMKIVPALGYVTVVILFFRQAFVTAGYYASRVPEILLATNLIFAQAAIIGLLSKDWVMSKLSKIQTANARLLTEYVDKYYYLILTALVIIIVMSNPYVGYGRQVWYVLYRLALSALLLPIFSWIHNKIKQTSSDLFFYYSDGSAVQERFSAGKTWYGLFVVMSFFTIILFGFFIAARIWGYDIGLYDVSHWLYHPFYEPGINEVTGKPIEVSVISLFKIVLYILGGVGIAYVANRFVLRRIFDPLLIGSGVQSTILTLSRYFIIVIALLIGLQSAGLDTMATKLAVLLGLLSFAIQKPISDFFAYFILLVQRPVKVGDLVKVDNDVFGIVRQITPRSTIVRYKNSVTLVIPNSRIINSTVKNWNYSKSFGAFDDITVTVPFKADPLKTRDLFFQVLNESPHILKNPAPVVWLVEFSTEGYQFAVRGYISNEKLHDMFEIASQIRIDIVRKLQENNIELAYPTRVMTFKPSNLAQVVKRSQEEITELSPENDVTNKVPQEDETSDKKDS